MTMSRKSLLIAMMLAFTASVLAQTAPPRPHDPEVWEWIDYYNPDYPESSCMSTLMFFVFQDFGGHPIDDRYDYGLDVQITGDTTETGEPIAYAWLDPEKLSYRAKSQRLFK